MSNFINKKVLLLNSSYEPLMIVSSRRAIVMLFLDKVDSILDTSCKVHSEKIYIKLPSVVKLKSYIFVKRKDISLTRKNIFYRDNNTCQYCGKSNVQLTLDHVVPKQKGGRDTWKNLVTSCNRCNSKKANSYIDDVGMRLINEPVKPHYLLYLQKYASSEYANWRPYLFMDKSN